MLDFNKNTTLGQHAMVGRTQRLLRSPFPTVRFLRLDYLARADDYGQVPIVDLYSKLFEYRREKVNSSSEATNPYGTAYTRLSPACGVIFDFRHYDFFDVALYAMSRPVPFLTRLTGPQIGSPNLMVYVITIFTP